MNKRFLSTLKRQIKGDFINPAFRSFYTRIQPFPLNQNKIVHFNNNLYTTNFKHFFSSNKAEKKTEKESEENKQQSNNDNETNKEASQTKNENVDNESKTSDSVSLKDFNNLKELYDDQEKKLSNARVKFDELRRAFLNNQEETKRILERNKTEIAKTKDFAITSFAKDLLDVHDNFERAVNSLNTDSELSAEQKLESFVEGIQMTHDSLKRIFSKHGIQEFNPKNQKFNPNEHEAMVQIDHDEIKPGHVAETIQTGFKIGTRILRPAKVGVVKNK